MRYLKRIAVLVLALSAAYGCKSQYEVLLEGNDTEAKYKAAFENFNNGKYTKASQLFESLSLVTSGTERDDTVQYYWALSNYSAKDYMTAETNFSNYLQNYPRSAFSESAQFLRLDCLYRSTLHYELDQTPTYTAITAISEYIMDNPSGANATVAMHMLEDLNSRLNKKEFENAKIYYTMEDYLASRVALRNILKNNADNIYREDILYYTAMSSYKYADMSVPAKQRERFLVFIDDYYNFIGEYPDSRYRKELDRLYEKVKEKK